MDSQVPCEQRSVRLQVRPQNPQLPSDQRSTHMALQQPMYEAAEQVPPHWPQLFLSSPRLTSTQVPLQQLSFGAQTLPHAPQLDGSSCVNLQSPLQQV